MLVWTLLACAELANLKEDVEGVTAPIVIEALFVGVAPPDEGVDLSGTQFESGAAVAVMVADAASVDNLADAPVVGADVALLLDTAGRVELNDEGSGQYTADGSDGVTYVEGDYATIYAGFDGQEARLRQRLPRTPDLSLPASAAPGQDLEIDLTGQGFDNVLVAVIDSSTGETVYDNTPDAIEEIYQITHGEGEQRVVVPGAALQNESVYLVGVAGLSNVDTADIDSANTALSAFLAGQMQFTAVSTLPPP